MSFTRHTDLLSVPDMLLFLKLVPTSEPLYLCPLCLECIYISSWHGWLLCFIHACMCESLESCPALRDSMYSSPPGSSVHGILQIWILEWVTMPSSRGSSRPRDRTYVSCLLHWQAGSLPQGPPGKPSLNPTFPFSCGGIQLPAHLASSQSSW